MKIPPNTGCPVLGVHIRKTLSGFICVMPKMKVGLPLSIAGKLGESHHRLNGFVRVPIQTGQCLPLVENRETEFDMFENPSIFLTFRENFYALDETVHEGFLFNI